MSKIIEIKRNYDVLYVYWTLTDFCNFRCNYCPAALHAGDFKSGRKPGFPSNDEIRTFIDRLINIHAKDKVLLVSIGGGEPTLHPMYEEIVNTLHPHGTIETITNGSRDFKWWQGLHHLPDKLTISLHPEFSKIDKINELGEFLLDNNVQLAYNMMCDPGNWNRIQEMYNQMSSRLRPYVSGKIITDHDDGPNSGTPWDYTLEQMEYIKSIYATGEQPLQRAPYKNMNISPVIYYEDGSSARMVNPFEVVNNWQHSFTGWECSAGRNVISIDFDGYAYAGNCGAQQLGRIDTFDLLSNPVICPNKWCKAAADIQTNKRYIAPGS